MANTVITNIAPTLNAVTVAAATLATVDDANGAETFAITFTKDGKGVIEINNVATDQGSVTFSLAAGDFWRADVALTGSVAQGVRSLIKVESSKYNKKDGTLLLTVTPATGIKLKTGHKLTIAAIEL